MTLGGPRMEPRAYEKKQVSVFHPFQPPGFRSFAGLETINRVRAPLYFITAYHDDQPIIMFLVSIQGKVEDPKYAKC